MSDTCEIGSQKQRERLAQAAHSAVRGVLDRGASGARARAGASRKISLTYRDGRPEKVSESSQRKLTLWLYVDGRYTTCETNDLSEDALPSFLGRAVALARAVEVDPDRLLPDPALYEKGEERSEEQLEVYDEAFGDITNDERHAYASGIEAAVRAEADTERLISVSSTYQDSVEDFVQVHSNGFEGARRETQRWGVADVSLRDEGDRRPSGWGVVASLTRVGLPEPAKPGLEALAAATARMGAAPIETAALPMVVENRAVGRLFRSLLAGLNGRAIQQRSSFLEGKRGEQVGSAQLDLVDDPLLPGGFASWLFDGEGLASRRRPVFENGVLRCYFLDTYYARKLGEEPTTGVQSNLVLTPGENDLSGLIADIERGVLVRGFLGGNSNPTTGDFSLGVYGTLIEKGELTRSVAEMNIAGNHLELWHHLEAVGSDVYPYESLLTPSLRFDAVQFSGK